MHHRFKPEFNKIGETSPKFLFAGDFPVITRNITVQQGQKLSFGSVVGRITTDDKYVLCSKTNTPAPTDSVPNPVSVDISDGSQEPQGILTEDVDASESDQQAIIYLTGQFNSNCMEAGEGYETNEILNIEIADKLRKLSIFTETGVKAFPRT
jgi:hypothetical protein